MADFCLFLLRFYKEMYLFWDIVDMGWVMATAKVIKQDEINDRV